MKIKLKLDDQQTRAVWETAQRAKDEVESWPAWKRGEDTSATDHFLEDVFKHYYVKVQRRRYAEERELCNLDTVVPFVDVGGES